MGQRKARSRRIISDTSVHLVACLEELLWPNPKIAQLSKPKGGTNNIFGEGKATVEPFCGFE